MIKRGHRHEDAGLGITLTRIPQLTKRGLLKAPYRFQIPPLDEFGWDASHSWEDYMTVRGGQFTREGGRMLRTIAFSSMALDWNPRWASWAGGHHKGGDLTTQPSAAQRALGVVVKPVREPGKDVTFRKIDWEPNGLGTNPQTVDHDLNRLLDTGTPMRLTVWNRALYGRPMVNWPVTLRTLSVRERAGEPDAHYYDFGFTEYRSPTYVRKGYDHAGGGAGRDLPAVVKISRDGVAIEIADGEDEDRNLHPIGSPSKPATLRILAKTFYGQSTLWPLIARANGIRNQGPNESLADIVRRGRSSRRLTIPSASAETWGAPDQLPDGSDQTTTTYG